MYGWDGIQQGNGLVLMIVGMLVVFSALVVLMFLMKGLKRYQEMLHNRVQERERARAVAEGVEIEPELGGDIPGTVVAAISLTILLEMESVHDHESMVLTLQALPKPYSNWWQSRIDPVWAAKTTKGRPTVMQMEDPERGKVV